MSWLALVLDRTLASACLECVMVKTLVAAWLACFVVKKLVSTWLECFVVKKLVSAWLACVVVTDILYYRTQQMDHNMICQLCSISFVFKDWTFLAVS
jgi:hypothetical protein